MHAPSFWKDTGPVSSLLLPVAAVYRVIAKRCRARAVTHSVSVPVICVGNLVAGGAGKTPVALALGTLLKSGNVRAHYVSRGYKGTLEGPVAVDAARHTAREVGDEPLLLAQELPTWVAKDRVAGARAAVEGGAQCIILDDGFQNAALHKNISLLVIDGQYGLGNARLLPAGPLREPIKEAFSRASAVVMIGKDEHNVLRHMPAGMKLIRAHIEPAPQARALAGKQVVAFAGIARPRKFYRTLQQLGAVIRKMVAYGDHHAFSARDIAYLREKASEHEAVLVTTTKDYVRLPPEARAFVTPVPIEVIFDDVATLQELLP